MNAIDRRNFLQKVLASGAGVVLGSVLPQHLFGLTTFSSPPVKLSAIEGDRIFENTFAAVDALGGIGQFVKKGSSVAMLINSVFDRPGTYVNPEIPLAVAKMCFDAGAKSVVTLENTPGGYFRRAAHAGSLAKEIGMISRATDKRDVDIPKGKAMKDGSVCSAMMSADVFINIPIIKDHQGTRYTGNLKNMMGAFSSATNRRCHFGDGAIVRQLFEGYYSKMDLLSQSIADLSLVRSPDLCVADVTEILATNGPSGPGRLKSPMQVVAGTNAVVVDMYSVQHLNLHHEELLVLQRAQDHALGPKDLKEVSILTK